MTISIIPIALIARRSAKKSSANPPAVRDTVPIHQIWRACRSAACIPGISGAKPATAPIKFDYVANGPKDLKIRIICRNRFFGETSRPHDMGPRLKTAFAAVDCEVMNPDSDDAEIGKCDLALVDVVHIFRKDATKRRRFLKKVRAKAAKVGMLELEPWMPGVNDRVAQNRDLYDFIWTMAPTLTEGEKIEALPVCLIPFPVGCPKIFDRSGIDPFLDVCFWG